MEMKDKLQKTLRKVETLRKRYLALLSEKKEMERKIERQELEIAQMDKELAQLPSIMSSCVWLTPFPATLKRLVDSKSRLPRWCGTLTGASNN